MDYKCPNCGSDETRSYRAIYEGGVSSGVSEVSLSSLSSQWLHGSNTIELMTDEARIAAKPSPRDSWLIGLGVLLTFGPFLVYVLALLFGLVNDWPPTIEDLLFGTVVLGKIVVPIIVLGLVFLALGQWHAARKNKTLDNEIEAWSRKWRCSRCATTFEVEPGPSSNSD